MGQIRGKRLQNRLKINGGEKEREWQLCSDSTASMLAAAPSVYIILIMFFLNDHSIYNKKSV